jgi:hypothetical protein
MKVRDTLGIGIAPFAVLAVALTLSACAPGMMAGQQVVNGVERYCNETDELGRQLFRSTIDRGKGPVLTAHCDRL